MNFGKILTSLRLERGIYQKALAEHLGVSIGTISNYEQGVHSPDLPTLCEIADYYDVSVDYLLGRTILRKNPSTFNKPLTEQYTIAEFINTTLQLETENARALTDYIELLHLKQAYGKKIEGSQTVEEAISEEEEVSEEAMPAEESAPAEETAE